jgi:hypothetical protein
MSSVTTLFNVANSLHGLGGVRAHTIATRYERER